MIASLKEADVSRAKIGGFDIDGVLRGKYVSLEKLQSALAKGFGFCDVIFGWDVADMLYDNVKVTGWETGYPDAHAVIDPKTLRLIPWEPGVAAFLCDFQDGSGKAHPACPRNLLKKVQSRAENMGFTPCFGAEFEFMFFKETPDSLIEKGHRGLQPLDPGMFGYSWLRTGQDAELMDDILSSMDDFAINIEGFHTETGPGIYECAIRFNDVLEAADQAALFKTSLKQIAYEHGLVASFMAKFSVDLPGASGHLHQSLWRDGKNAFYDGSRKHGMSKTMRHYLAGQMALMQDLTAVYSPTINSYKRYAPGLWAPLVTSWGVDNRTCALRVVAPDEPSSLRIENRQTAADINPYLAMAASLGAGLYGIEKQLELSDMTQGDAGTDGPGKLPNTLKEATARFRKSRPVRQVLGNAFVDHYAATREWEVREYEKAVTDWELRRYFETV
ncbi:MAG: glutamine synthetase [Polyangiaceae bacterium]|nr:glutamine synthetase [Polyangiaceae bacterium]